MIKNLKNLEQHLQKLYEKGDLKNANGKTVQAVPDDVLRDEAERLHTCIQRQIDLYYDFYNPNVYKRTYGLQKALEVDTRVCTDEYGGKFIGLFFYESKNTGHSIWGGEDVFKSQMINDGWKVTSGWHKQIEHFGRQKPYKFIEKAVKDWRKDLKYPIDVIKIDYYGNRSVL